MMTVILSQGTSLVGAMKLSHWRDELLMKGKKKGLVRMNEAGKTDPRLSEGTYMRGLVDMKSRRSFWKGHRWDRSSSMLEICLGFYSGLVMNLLSWSAGLVFATLAVPLLGQGSRSDAFGSMHRVSQRFWRGLRKVQGKQVRQQERDVSKESGSDFGFWILILDWGSAMGA